MGLDQYMYVALKEGQRTAFYENVEFDPVTHTLSNPHITEPRQIAYRRKHPSLHGYMEQLWRSRGEDRHPDDFNGEEVELSYEDVQALEDAIRHKQLPVTEGFFFGSGNDEQYYDDDLQMCADLKAEIFLGFRVFYNSSW